MVRKKEWIQENWQTMDSDRSNANSYEKGMIYRQTTNEHMQYRLEKFIQNW